MLIQVLIEINLRTMIEDIQHMDAFPMCMFYTTIVYSRANVWILVAWYVRCVDWNLVGSWKLADSQEGHRRSRPGWANRSYMVERYGWICSHESMIDWLGHATDRVMKKVPKREGGVKRRFILDALGLLRWVSLCSGTDIAHTFVCRPAKLCAYQHGVS